MSKIGKEKNETQPEEFQFFGYFTISYLQAAHNMLQNALINKHQSEIHHLQNKVASANQLASLSQNCELSFCVLAAMYNEAAINYFFYFALKIDVRKKRNKTASGKTKNNYLSNNDKKEYLADQGLDENLIKKWIALANLRNDLLHPKFDPIPKPNSWSSFGQFMPQIFCTMIDLTKALVEKDKKINGEKAILSRFMKGDELERFNDTFKNYQPHLPDFDVVYEKGKLQLPVTYGIAPIAGFMKTKNQTNDLDT